MKLIISSNTAPELYDLEKDPSEFENLAGKKEFQTVERELRTVLAEWMILERDFLPLPTSWRNAARSS